MAAIKDKKRGTWQACFRLKNYKGETKTIHKRGFRNKKAAQTYENHIKAVYGTAIDISVTALCERYSLDKTPEHRPATQENLRMVCKHAIIPYLGKKSVLDLTPAVLLDWRNELVRHKGKSYAHTAHRVLSRILNHAVNCYNLPSNPLKTLPPIKLDKHEMKFWPVEDYQKVSAVAYESEPDIAIALDILFYCGLRSGELLALTPRDIDSKAGTITITKTYHSHGISGPPKTKNSHRTVDVPKKLNDKLADFIRGVSPDKRVWPIAHNTLLNHFQKITDTAGLERIRLHDLRHSHVTLLIEQQVPITAISRRLGHTVNSVLAYSHANSAAGKKIADKLDSLIP